MPARAFGPHIAQGLRVAVHDRYGGPPPGLLHAVGLRQRQFHAAHAAADDDKVRGVGRGFQERLPPRGIATKRLGADAMGGEAFGLRQVGRDANVDGGDVERDLPPAGELDGLGGGIEAHGAVQDHLCPGEAAQADKVDHDLVDGVMARDGTGEHTGIGRDGAGVDDPQAHPRHGLHPPFAQDKRMAMAPADEQDVAGVREV